MLVQWYNFCHKKLDHRHLSCWQQCWQYFVYSWMLHLLEYRVAIAVSEEISASIFSLKSFEEEIWKHQFPHKVDQNLPVCMTTYCRIFKIFHYRKCSSTFYVGWKVQIGPMSPTFEIPSWHTIRHAHPVQLFWMSDQPSAGFETSIPIPKLLHVYVLDRTATDIGLVTQQQTLFCATKCFCPPWLVINGVC